MQKASIGKILLALVIACIYIYLFGIVQVVHVSADNDREIEVSIPDVTTPEQTQKTPETTTIKLQSDKKPALNVDLWERLLPLIAAHDVRYHWVKGHAENENNNRCDELAVAESRKYK